MPLNEKIIILLLHVSGYAAEIQLVLVCLQVALDHLRGPHLY